MSPPPIPVSVIVCTRDEAANLEACLAALARFDQVLVVDSASTDGTGEIARRHGAGLVPFRWDGRYPKKKEWARRHAPARHDWLLYIDADEQVTPALAAEIAALMAAGPRHAGYWVRGRYGFLGRPLRFGPRTAKLALIDRRRAWYPPCPDLDVDGGWEVEGHYQPAVAGSAGRLGAPLLHWDRKPLAAYIDRHNRYSDWHAGLAARGRLAALRAAEPPGRRRLKALLARLPARPLLAFLHAYVLRLGLLDGAAGFHLAVSRAVYWWLIDAKTHERKAAARPPCPGE